MTEPDPRGAVREILARSVADERLTDGLRDPWATDFNVIYRSPDLTILNVIWPPLMTLFPHDHRMWAAMGSTRGS